MSCNVNGNNLGGDCKKQRGRLLGAIFSTQKTAIPIDDFETEADIRAYFQTGGMHIFTGNKNTITQPERQEVTLDGGEVLKLGVNSAKFVLQTTKVSDVVTKAVKSWDGATVYGFLVYAGGFVQGKSFDGTNIEPVSMTLSQSRIYPVQGEAEYNVLNAMLNEGEQESLDSNQLTLDVNETATDYDFADLLNFELKDVKVTVGAGATGASQALTIETLEGIGVAGLVAADVVFTKGATTATATTLTDNGDGSYTAAHSPALAAGTWVVSLLSPSTLSLKGYENTVTGSFTV